MRRSVGWLLSGLLALSAGTALGEEANSDSPRPIPLTRPEVKQLLEEMKDRTPRIPLPELTDADREALGERADSYEARLRYHYAPQNPNRNDGRGAGGGEGLGGGRNREPDPNSTLDYPFKTMLFWIVSRTNNCQYCLGHQEIKLAVAGLTEEQIAALDGNWSIYTPAEQAAFAYARKFTYEPHLLSDADIDALRPYYTDLQILEMSMSMAGNNSINRWKEGTGVPQSRTLHNFSSRSETPPPADRILPTETFLTPTPEEYLDLVTSVAPLDTDATSGAPAGLAVSHRPPLESPEEVEAALSACRQRTPRLPLVSEDETRKLLEGAAEGPIPQWMRLLANFPRDGVRSIRNTQDALAQEGDLTPLMKAQAAWIIARQDRAWYATGLAKQWLGELGQTDEQTYQLDGDWSEFTPAERSLFTLARNLACSPVVLTDVQVNEALAQTSPRHVVQMITFTTGRASFNRITECAGLQLE